MQFLFRFRHETIFCVELPWIALNPLVTAVPNREDFCNDVANLLDSNHVSTVCMASHSYGSFMTSWCLSFPRLSKKISRCVLVSPAAMCIFLPKTCRTVVYEQPFWFEYSLAQVFFRQFHWYDCLITAKDLPKGSLVVLMEKDELIPIADVAEDCIDHGVSYSVISNIGHGFEVLWPIVCAKLVHAIRNKTKLGQKDKGRTDGDVKHFFHNARNSYLYSAITSFALDVLDVIASTFFLGGHSPYNLDMLARIDGFWQSIPTPMMRGRSRSSSSLSSVSTVDSNDGDIGDECKVKKS